WACSRIIVKDGAKKLTIDALCQELKMTKGSFYHHFKGMDDFVDAFLMFFEQEGTLQIIETVEQQPTPQAKLRKLIELSTEYAPELESSVRAWALQDGRVRAVFERVDQQRLEYLTHIWRPLVADDATALVRAQMMYTILIGSNHVLPPIEQKEIRAVFAAYLEAFQL
ncbi:MAG: TetR/AcrR family transcriptional regulator, partial [Anaerolineae bacterium]